MNHKLSIQNAFNEPVSPSRLHAHLSLDTATHLDPVQITRNISFRRLAPPLVLPMSFILLLLQKTKTIHNSYLFDNFIYFFSLLITDVIYILLVPVAVFVPILLLLRRHGTLRTCCFFVLTHTSLSSEQ